MPGHGVAVRERRDEPVDEVRIREAEEVADGVGLDGPGGGREQLVEDRLRVTHAAGRQPRDERDRLRVRLAVVRLRGSARACR